MWRGWAGAGGWVRSAVGEVNGILAVSGHTNRKNTVWECQVTLQQFSKSAIAR